MIRWPGKINAGRVSNEIFASLDWMPTLASLIGEQQRLPKDRPLDGIDQSSFLLGDEKSNREHIIFYIGNELFSIKWRTLKIHFKTIEKLLTAPVHNYIFPPIYDVVNDPGEVNDIFIQNAWAIVPARKIIHEKTKSFKQYPNIQPGENFKGYKK